jgi:hypothetical protein
MDKIPVSFEYKGKHYTGYFDAVSGAAGKLWYLTLNGFHWGQLIYTENFGWRFENNKGTMKELTDYFADVVTAWYE